MNNLFVQLVTRSFPDLTRIQSRQPATITKMVQRMQEAGFVQRCRDPQDQRVSRVYLTAAGREIQERVRQVWQQLEDEALAGFTPEERTLLRRFLVQIRDNFALVHTCVHACERADKHQTSSQSV